MFENVNVRPVETVPGMLGRRIKENDGVAEFKYGRNRDWQRTHGKILGCY
jgi:hypothetical protein